MSTLNQCVIMKTSLKYLTFKLLAYLYTSCSSLHDVAAASIKKYDIKLLERVMLNSWILHRANDRYDHWKKFSSSLRGPCMWKQLSRKRSDLWLRWLDRLKKLTTFIKNTMFLETIFKALEHLQKAFWNDFAEFASRWV